MLSKKIARFVVSIFLCQLAGIIGSLFTTPSIATWYASLNKVSFSPPNWVFAPVWITLYFLMGISLYLVWGKKTAMMVFFVQLALNTFWSIIFFGFHNILLAFIEIVILWFAILATMIVFYKESKTASFLLIPYFLWVSFASVLNFAIFLVN